ncbi:MAG TPA: tetratricopeptide repeat protein [bacterium]|nr:tetratricopeptide repeat protein [bacterium]
MASSMTAAGRGHGFISRGFPLLLVLPAAAAFRIALLWEHSRSPLFHYLRIDEGEYDLWARDVANGFLFPDTLANHGAGYPWLLGGLYYFFGPGLILPRLVQMALGLASIVLVHRIAARLFNKGAALAAALLFGLYWPQMLFEQRILDATLFTFLNLAWLLGAVRAVESGRARAWAATGLLIGAAAVVRPTPVICLAALFVWLMYRAARERSQAPALGALAMLAACLIIILPVMAGGRLASGHWSLLQAEGGLNLYIGNNPDADGTPYARPGGVYDRLQALPVAEAGITDPAGQDRFYMKKIFEFMRRDPARFWKLQLKKAALLVNHRELRASVNPEFQRSLFPALRLPLPGFGVILALALAGLPALRWRRRGHQVFMIHLAAFAGFTVATVVSSRYRLPLAAGMMVLAGAGAMELGRAALLMRGKEQGRRGRLPRAAAPVALMLLGLGLSRLPVAPHYTDAEDWSYMGGAWLEQGNRERAADSYEKALALDPSLAEAMMGMARLEQENGDAGAARQWLTRAAAADPGGAAAHHALGLLLWEQGEKTRAIAELTQAVHLRPQWLPGYNDLARREWDMGMHDQAIAHLKTVLRMYPDFSELKALVRELEREAARPAGGGSGP